MKVAVRVADNPVADVPIGTQTNSGTLAKLIDTDGFPTNPLNR
jgi:hypothetical protein